MRFSFYNNAIERFQKLKKKKSFKYGLPFLLFLFVGSFGLERFATLRYEFRKTAQFSPKNLDDIPMKKKKVVLEEEYEKYTKVDINSWENIRGPRPWEEQQEQQQKSTNVIITS